MSYRTHPNDMPGGPARDSDDHARLRHARDRNLGFPVGRYLQPSPMLFTRDGHNVFLGDMFRGSTAFLLCGGPSLNSHDLSSLQGRGILTCAVNNAATVFRPQLWVSVDDPQHFSDAIWRDPAIWKFVPFCHMEKNFAVRDGSDQLVPSAELVGDMPAVFGYRRNESFDAEQWLFEDTFNWGNNGDRTDAYGYRGSRSVMLVALRLLFYLGVRKLFLLGCDFHMQYGTHNYAFEQHRSRGSVTGNNYTFKVLNVRLKHLLPHFEREGYQIFNCTPDSGLTAFPHLPFDSAIKQIEEYFPCKIITAGMYDQKAKVSEKQPGDALTSIFGPSPPPESLRKEETMLPATTLVTHVNTQSEGYLALTWATWNRHHPWLNQIPAIVVHAHDHDTQKLRDQIKQLHPNVNFIPVNSGIEFKTADEWSHAALRYGTQHVKTPWTLKLVPEAIAVEDVRWLDPTWFSTDKSGQPPAFVTCPWGYSRPADILDRLDRWGDTVAELAKFEPLHVPFDPQCDRVMHPSVNSWLLMCSTEWARTVMRYVPDGLPCASFDTFLVYCARRRKDRYILHQMKNCGWDHSFRGHHRLADRCRALLNC